MIFVYKKYSIFARCIFMPGMRRLINDAFISVSKKVAGPKCVMLAYKRNILPQITCLTYTSDKLINTFNLSKQNVLMLLNSKTLKIAQQIHL